jgi:hypothetical protein
MSIFDIIADILFTKKKSSLSNIDNESTFSPFMLNRWISMYSNSLAIKCNLLNKFITFNKQTAYTLFFNVFDKMPQKKITYYKKIKESTESDDKEPMIAKSLELSYREIKLYEDVLTSLKSV